ncbi:882_t:CDS:2, partial [Gigaspora margarita]
EWHENQEFMQLSNEQQSQLIHKQQYEDQGFVQLSHEQQSDEESDCINEDIEYKIEDGAEFPNWDTLERTLKKHELEVGFKSIKFRLKRDNNGDIIQHQPKKKVIDADHRERDSKKIGCPWQLNAGCRKNVGTIFINKLINEHNHSLAPYRKEFAPSLHSLSQEVLDEIKFLTQECSLGAKAQHQYLSKKFSAQPLYDRDLYNTIHKYKNEMSGNQRENNAADMVKWLMQQKNKNQDEQFLL